MKNELMKCSQYLVGCDADNASDEEFAEFFALMNKIHTEDEKASDVSEKDMKNFNIDDFTNWLNTCLHEIVDENSDCCKSAWWKQN